MAEWIEKTLGEVTAFITKGIPPKYVDKENQDTVCVLNQKCNRNFEISYVESRLHNMSLKKVPSEKMLYAGDVLINSTGTGNRVSLISVNRFDSLVFDRIIENIGFIISSNSFRTSSVGKLVG